MGQDIAPRDLTTMQAAFVRHMGSGNEPKAAALLAGYAPNSAVESAYDLLRTPAVLAAVLSESRRQLVAAAPMSVFKLRWLRDNATSEKVQADAARTLLDRAGLIAPRAVADSKGSDLSLHEMSLADLRGLADKLESELATRAKPVSSANAAPTPSQAIDLA